MNSPECHKAQVERKIYALITRIDIVERRVIGVENLSACSETEVDDLENRSRQSNFVFYGVRETQPMVNRGMRLQI